MSIQYISILLFKTHSNKVSHLQLRFQKYSMLKVSLELCTLSRLQWWLVLFFLIASIRSTTGRQYFQFVCSSERGGGISAHWSFPEGGGTPAYWGLVPSPFPEGREGTPIRSYDRGTPPPQLRPGQWSPQPTGYGAGGMPLAAGGLSCFFVRWDG